MVTLAREEDRQGHAGDDIIGQHNHKTAYHDFHESRTRRHHPSSGPAQEPGISMTYSDLPSAQTAFI